MMELLLSLIYSFRLGKWDLLLEYICSIILSTFACSHLNYARYLPALLGEMLSLEDDYPDIYERFEAGEFSVRITLNKDTKTPGGTTEFSTSVNAV